ncbi:Suppressor protein SRP40 [Heracleum sosnowskyi]|uniref:Suppressor protein SRP40 n=1 Tax=Heracleum sosnowskyi TaxID=360622 RepID=A0AAD8NCT5_9APIA|nr:Suppressor protein SRP40 [Heracleum sosnowskyi]
MENLVQGNKVVDDKLSKPVKPIQDQEFEFEFVTPKSPNSPADHLFLNGRLLPHDFPCPPTKSLSLNTTLSRTMSRTSSVSSKDSLMSSRSNSTNSRSSSSSCSTSARTSTSDVSERRVLMNRSRSATRKPELFIANRPSLSKQYGSWQYVTQTPVLTRKSSRKNKAETDIQQGSKRKKQDVKGKKQGDEGKKQSGGFFWRFFRWFVSACNECHAINPSKRETVFQGSINSQ